MRIKGLSWEKRSFGKALRTFALSLGAAALCVLSSFSPADASAPAAAASSISVSVKAAVPEKVVPLGSVFGIKLFTNGVIVTSLADIYTENGVCCPAADAGIRPGDYVLEAGGRPVVNNAGLAGVIGGSGGEAVTLKVKRDDRVFETSVTPICGDGSFKTGMWVRDSAAGIGTLTFYDPASGMFAGLGHGVCDMDTNGVMTLKRGELAPIALCGLDRGEKEKPGMLKGYFASDEPMGTLTVNEETGVYGTLTETPSGKAMAVLPRDRVQCGPVQLMITLDERGPRLYDGEILRIGAADQPTKNFVVKVTDPELLDAAGGILQGMSGSPILQNGKLAGAVTHVFLDDPAVGYGIFAQTMCEEIARYSANK